MYLKKTGFYFNRIARLENDEVRESQLSPPLESFDPAGFYWQHLYMKKWIHSPEFGILIFRLFVGLAIAFSHGLGKMPPSDKFVSSVSAIGFPLPFVFAWSAALAEFFGGLCIAAGLFTRYASSFLGFTMIVAAFGQHRHDSFGVKEMSLLYLAACVLLIFSGAGRFSLDRIVRKV